MSAIGSMVRFSALGGSMVVPLFGVASAARPTTIQAVLLVAAMGLFFHLFAYLLNDVVDLPLDRTDPRRARSPLVNGLVTPAVMAGAAGVMLAVAVLAAAQAAAPAVAALVAAAIGLGTYDLLGKRTRWPALADLVQGVGWGALVLAGSWAAGGPSPLSIAIGGYIVLFIVMTNGVHGALRDLVNDTRHGVRTTAAMLGATVTVDGRRDVPRPVLAYAWALQGGLLGVTVAAVLAAGGSPAALVPSMVAVVLLGAASRARSDAELMAAGMLHLIVGLAVPIALLAGPAPLPLVALISAVYIVPLLSHGSLPAALAWGQRAAGRATGFALELVRLVRPLNGLAAAMAVGVGAHLGGRAELATEPVLRAGIVAALVVAAANVANDRADVAQDRINQPTRPIPSGRVSRTAAGALALALAALATIVAASLGTGPAVAAAVLAGVGFAYSSHLRRVPVLGHVVVAALAASTIGFGAAVLGRPTPTVAIVMALIFLSVASSEVLKATADRIGDRAAGKSTVATLLSFRASLQLHASLVAVVMAVALAPALVGFAPPAFLIAAVAGIVAPHMLMLVMLRGARQPQDVRPALTVSKLSWFTGLAALIFLV